jgi:hypothetical protein
MMARASYLLHARGRRSGVAQGRSEPPVAVSGLLLHELYMLLANHVWPNVEKTITFIWQVTYLAIQYITNILTFAANYM